MKKTDLLLIILVVAVLGFLYIESTKNPTQTVVTQPAPSNNSGFWGGLFSALPNLLGSIRGLFSGGNGSNWQDTALNNLDNSAATNPGYNFGF